MARVKTTVISLLEAGDSPTSSDEERPTNERAEDEVEAGSDEELDEVDASLEDLVGDDNSEKPTYDFGRSEVTSSLIKSFEKLQYFPKDDGRAPGRETVPSPEANEVMGLRFPSDPMLAEILDRFNVQFPQLTLNAIVQLSKFFWVVKTF